MTNQPSRPKPPSSSIGAQIGASLASGSKPKIQIQKTLSPKSARHLQAIDEDDTLDESKLPQEISPEQTASPKDLFWPITGILAMVLLTGSFLTFLMISRTPPMKAVSKRGLPSASPSVDLSHQGTYLVGDGSLPTPSPSADPSVRPSIQAIAPVPLESASVEAVLPPALPLVSATPLRPPVVIPPKIQVPKIQAPKLPSPKASAIENSPYQVIAGPYPNQNEAENGSSQLSDLGKTVKVKEEGGKYWLWVGEAFPQQEEALGLAEQVVQKGHQVTIKKQ